MEAYKVIKPATLQELDAALRTNPLGSKFPIIIEENLDGNDIAKRRGIVPKKEEATFSAASIDVTPLTDLRGRPIKIGNSTPLINDVAVIS